MNELENRHRKYLGLAETDHSWIRVEVKEHVIYHNGVHVLKHIEPVPDRFSKTEISKFKSCGVYFSYCKPHVKIGNINLQRTFIEDETADLDTWLDRWISDSTDADLDELKKFSSAARCRQKYREGDFFAFKLSRRSWGFGRIIYDIGKRRKTDFLYSDISDCTQHLRRYKTTTYTIEGRQISPTLKYTNPYISKI